MLATDGAAAAAAADDDDDVRMLAKTTTTTTTLLFNAVIQTHSCYLSSITYSATQPTYTRTDIQGEPKQRGHFVSVA